MKKRLLVLLLVVPFSLGWATSKKETIDLVREIGIAEAYLKRLSGHPVMNISKEIKEKLPAELQDASLEELLATYLEKQMSEEEIRSALEFFRTPEGASLAKALYRGKGNFDQTDEMIQNWVRFRMRMIEQIKRENQSE